MKQDSGNRMILIRSGMGPISTEQTLIHEMVHAKLSSIRKEIHGKRFLSELRRLRKLGAPLSPFELDRVRNSDPSSREPIRLTKKKVRILISKAIVTEKLPPRLVPRYLEQEVMVPYSIIKRSVNIGQEIRRAQSSKKS